MIHMLPAAKRAGMVEGHLRIQRFVAGIIGSDTPVFQDTEFRTLEYLVLSRTDKNKFHFFKDAAFKKQHAQLCLKHHGR